MYHDELNDRNIVPADEKFRVLDFYDKPITPPTTGIYEGELRYYAANKEWATIIEGLIDYLSTPAAWDNSVTDESHHAIQQILIFEEGVIVATVEEICEAVQCALKEAAGDYLRGALSTAQDDICINPDGSVTVTPVGETPDDPTTPTDNEARAGGASGVRLGINTLWSNLVNWANAGVTAMDAKSRLKLIYNLNDIATDLLVDQWYADKNGALPYTTNFASTLDSYVYCKGNTPQVIAEWIYEKHTANLQSQASLLVPALTQAQLDTWFNQGKIVPNADYITFSCVPNKPESFLLDGAYLVTSTYKHGVQTCKLLHRYMVIVSGKCPHPSDGSYQDFFYRHESDGTVTAIGLAGTYGTKQFNDPFGAPPNSKIPFQASGEYRFTMETTTTNPIEFRRYIPPAHYASGSFNIEFIDLGEIVN